MTALAASSVRVKTLADGTLRAEIDFDPPVAPAAFKLLGSPGQPLAVAALKVKTEKPAAEGDKPKGGPWSQWLAVRCGEPEFVQWVRAQWPVLWVNTEETDPTKKTAEIVRRICGVQSRAEIDNDPEAAARFQEGIRGPWTKHYQGSHA
jgi:hypothetical protein